MPETMANDPRLFILGDRNTKAEHTAVGAAE